MKPLVITNVEYVEDVPFFVVVLFNDSGEIDDQITLPYDSPAQVLDKIADLAMEHALYPIDLWTSDRDIYAAALGVPGINAEYHVRSDTDVTERIVRQDYDILCDLYDIERYGETGAAPLPGWRRWIIHLLEKLIKKLKGDGEYEQNDKAGTVSTAKGE